MRSVMLGALVVVLFTTTAAATGGAFSDDDGNIHEPAIDEIAAVGITTGCNPPDNDHYCPAAPVTRGHMATFLARALDLPASGTDHFGDDSDSVHQDAINSIAAAGITLGCGTESYCPLDSVARDQMASFLARGFDVAAASGDWFTDDGASVHQDAINSIAQVGITNGCNPPDNDHYCPSQPVRRDQMASFLVRALGLEEPSIWQPAPGTTWQWQLTGTIDLSIPADVFDIDGFDATAQLVADIHAQGAEAICYISAGSWEDWRPDADEFPESVKGTSNGWPGELWLDIRQIDVLGPIMEARLDMCREKGFDAIEPDNIDGHGNDTGFPLTPDDQLAYNTWLAYQAHQRGLSIGLKNAPDLVGDLLDLYDWALSEECFTYDECELFSPFIADDKAVFHVQYDLATSEFCPAVNALGFSSMLKNLDLDAFRETCW